MNELPEGWEVKKLGEVCEIFQGYGFPKNLQGEKSGNIPFYKVGDISKNIKAGFRYLELCDNFIDDNILLKIKAKTYPSDTIVFAKIGEGLKLNRRAIIKTPGIVDNNAIGLKAIEKVCSDLFLFYFLTTVKLEDYSRATTVPSVRKSDIEDIPFPLPPLPVQQAIVAKIEEVFSELDKGVQQLETARQQLKVYRQSVLKWAFEGRLTNENVVDGELPEGWKWVKLGEVAETCLGKMLDKQKNIGTMKPYLGNINVRWGRFDLDDLPQMRFEEKENERYGLRKGDLVICEGGEPGRAAIWKEQVSEMKIQKALHRVRFNENVSTEFFYNYLQLIAQVNKLDQYFTGTTIKHLTGQSLKKIEFPLPPLSEQHRIVAEIERRLRVCDALEAVIEKSLRSAAVLRQGVLGRAFSGRLVGA